MPHDLGVSKMANDKQKIYIEDNVPADLRKAATAYFAEKELLKNRPKMKVCDKCGQSLVNDDLLFSEEQELVPNQK